MSFYTIFQKTITCPCYNRRITLNGYYYFSDDENTNPHEATFHYAKCPLVENSKLPYYEQDEEFKYLHCLNSDERCDFFDAFPSKKHFK